MSLDSRGIIAYFSDSAERSLRGRVLICAQSNAAVDELLSRLSEGGNNKRKNLNVNNS
jgi:AAA domain